MRVLIHPLYLTHRQLRIPLRRRETLMPQHLLDRPQVRAFLQHVRSKRMAQRVRMHIRRQLRPSRCFQPRLPQPQISSNRRRCLINVLRLTNKCSAILCLGAY